MMIQYTYNVKKNQATTEKQKTSPTTVYEITK